MGCNYFRFLFDHKKELIDVFDRQTRKLRSKIINLIKVQWRHCRIKEVTWEIEFGTPSRYITMGGMIPKEFRSILCKFLL